MSVLQHLDLLEIGFDGPVPHVRLNRPAKRNALNDPLIAQLQTCFTQPAAGDVGGRADRRGRALLRRARPVRAGRAQRREAGSRIPAAWHAAMDPIQFGRVPVVAVLHGAVVGGGLELASATHVRIAEEGTYYGLPEGQRGIFVGGGGSARIPRLIGFSRMTDMMLTGRVLDAHEGQQVGLAAVPGARAARASPRRATWRAQMAGNAPLSNFAVIQALPRIAGMTHGDAQFVESLMAAIAQGDRCRQAADARVPGRARRQGRQIMSADGTDTASRAPVRSAAASSATVSRDRPRRHADHPALGPSRCSRSRAPDRPARALGPRGARPHLRRAARPRRRLDPDQLRADAGARPHRRPGAGAARPVAERPVAILSDNDLEHLTLALGAMWAGVPYAPVSPAYSLVSQDYGKLRHILGIATPGLVFASRPRLRPRDRGGGRRRDRSGADRRAVPGPPVTRFASLLETTPGPRSTPRMRASTPTPSPSSCSPRARPRPPRA